MKVCEERLHAAAEAELYDDRPQEECGVFGIWVPGTVAPEVGVAQLTFEGLEKLQHRGQDGAGIAASDGRNVLVHKAEGRVAEAFGPSEVLGTDKPGAAFLDAAMPGAHLAIGHTRYGITGGVKNPYDALHPHLKGRLAVGHNGNLPNAKELAEELGVPVQDDEPDSKALTNTLGAVAQALGSTDAAIDELMPRLNGAASLVIADGERLIGVRDVWGFRPLVLGKRADGGYVLASETVALAVAGAERVRDIEPGEIVTIDDEGVHSRRIARAVGQTALCYMELVYFAKAEGTINNTSVAEARRAMGRELAREHPAPAGDDVVVVGLPESGLRAAEGYAEVAQKPLVPAATKREEFGRSFIARTQEERAQIAYDKQDIDPELVRGKAVVIIDDSIVRGTTLKAIIRKFRDNGATAVHVRIPSAVYKNGCTYGVATGDETQLLAYDRTLEEMCHEIGADSLGFLSVEGVRRAIVPEVGGLCMMCADGDDPCKRDPVISRPIPLGMPGRRAMEPVKV